MTSPLPLWAGRSLVLLGIILVALNLRTAVSAVSPIVDNISPDIPLDSVALGVIGLLPPIVYAVSGILGAAVARRIGLERFVIWALIATAAGHLVRAAAPDFFILFVGSIVVLLGGGVGNVLLPPLVKRYFPDRVGLVTAIYTSVMALGTAMVPAFASPLAETAGWRVSFIAWAAMAVVALVPWIVPVLRSRRLSRSIVADLPAEQAFPHAGRGIWRSKVAWLVAVTFAMGSFNAYCMFAWLPLILIQSAHLTPAAAGAMLAYFAALGIPMGLLAPILAARVKNIALPIQIAAMFLIASDIGLLVAPAAAPWVWVTFAGLGGSIFPICLVLINLRSRTELGSTTLSGFAQGVGYTIAAAGPFVIGVLRDVEGGWAGALWVLIATAIVAAAASQGLRKPRFVEDELGGGAAFTRS